MHIVAVVAEADGRGLSEGSGFDHVSFKCTGLQQARHRLQAINMPYEEAPVPGWPIWQIFVRDPLGCKIELTFAGEQ